MNKPEDRKAFARKPLPDDAMILIPMRNTVLFPGVISPITVGRRVSVAAAQEAVREECACAGRRAAILDRMLDYGVDATIGYVDAAEELNGQLSIVHGRPSVFIAVGAGMTVAGLALGLKHLGSPARLYEKTPTADLLDDNPGQADETELGISYAAIDAYLEGEEVDDEIAAKIEHRYRVTEHKRRIPVAPYDTWWKQR